MVSLRRRWLATLTGPGPAQGRGKAQALLALCAVIPVKPANAKWGKLGMEVNAHVSVEFQAIRSPPLRCVGRVLGIGEVRSRCCSGRPGGGGFAEPCG